MPTVSIIIPTYNRAQLLRQALCSVLAQTYEDHEAIVIDDGSTDNTQEIVESIQDSRIRYIYQDNKGVAMARNIGLDLARGRYIAFLDSDDVWLPPLLETELAAHARHPNVGVVYARTGRINDDLEFPYLLELLDNGGEEFTGNMFRELLTGACMLVLTMVVKRELFERAGGFNTSMKYGEDWDIWLRISKLCDFHRIPSMLALYRVHSGQASNDSAGMLTESLKILNTHVRELPENEQKEAIYLGERQLHQWYGFVAMMDGLAEGKEWLALAQDRACRLGEPGSVAFSTVRHTIYNIPYNNKARERATPLLREMLETLHASGATLTPNECMREFWAASTHAAYKLQDSNAALHCARRLIFECGLSHIDRGICSIAARSMLRVLKGQGGRRLRFPVEDELPRVVGVDRRQDQLEDTEVVNATPV